ncbi:phospholipase A [Variovorax sp. PCZ-1]|uniref:phospholipase A n=1 Tax=Variovorax sp. PCZ-1 TaxID=2835533 RepID=UPI0020C0CB86|nr:phospholipase A [Variovorax sp. PCZ-1]
MKIKLTALAATCCAAAVQAQMAVAPLACQTIAESTARLACYDNWAQQQSAIPTAVVTPTPAQTPNPVIAPVIELTNTGRAAIQPSEIMRFWDLEKASARDTFQLRGYRPVSLSVVGASQVNTLPSSPTNGSPASAVAYSPSEMKINLSVRTKLASGLLHRADQPLSDSIWFGYSQQSYWQLFNGTISRPFRSTDHEPELIYVFGHNRPLPGGFTYRMSGAGIVHQSNGQSLPLSRSWNRVYVMAAADKITSQGNHFTLQVKGWQRLPESAGKDDNPDISNFVGRAEFAGRWSFDSGSGADLRTHTLGMTVRHSMRKEGRGSVRLEYLRSLGAANSGLRFHTQLFSGYGDSLIDYNRNRTVLSVGLSLVDW